jgi:hypothetical protein
VHSTAFRATRSGRDELRATIVHNTAGLRSGWPFAASCTWLSPHRHEHSAPAPAIPIAPPPVCPYRQDRPSRASGPDRGPPPMSGALRGVRRGPACCARVAERAIGTWRLVEKPAVCPTSHGAVQIGRHHADVVCAGERGAVLVEAAAGQRSAAPPRAITHERGPVSYCIFQSALNCASASAGSLQNPSLMLTELMFDLVRIWVGCVACSVWLMGRPSWSRNIASNIA